MRNHDLQRMRQQVDEAGAPEHRLRMADSVRVALDQDLGRLRDTLAVYTTLFRRKLEVWTGRLEPHISRPFALPEETRTARQYGWYGLVCLAIEAVLAGWIFFRMGIMPWFGAVFALLMGVVCEGIVHHGLNNVDRPRETLRKIRDWVLTPGAILFVPSLIVLLLARIAEGVLAVQFLTGFNIALWLCSASVLILAAAFLAAREVLLWSQRDTETYEALNAEEAQTRAFRNQIEGEYQELASTIGRLRASPADGHSSHDQPQSVPSSSDGSFTLPIVLILLGLLSSTACTVNAPVEGGAKLPQNVAPLIEYDLDIYGDVSRSPDSTALSVVYRTLIPIQLVELAERWHIRRVATYRFGEDGWNCTQTFAVDLPRVIRPKPLNSSGSEIAALFPNLTQAVQEDQAQQLARQEEQARQTYRAQLRNALGRLDASGLLPIANSPEPPCTDLVGLGRRVTLVPGARPKLTLVITDGRETCARRMAPIPRPTGNVGPVVVVLVPPRKRNGRAYQAFEASKTDILRVMPWCEVIPHFDTEYNRAFSRASEKTQ